MSGTADNFPACVAFTFAEEGGYTDDPLDSGGPTSMGITLATLSHWRGTQCTPADVQGLSQAEASNIYRALYWQAINCDAMPAGIDLLCFDFAVNAGPRTSTMELQATVGVAQDGDVGPDTLDAIAGVAPATWIEPLRAAHEAHYRSLVGFPTFGNGWLARLGRCAQAALAMAQGGA